MLTELTKLPVGQLLGLSVLGALVTTVGSLVALVLKEYLFVRSFERWKSKQTLTQIYKKYRDPILLAAEELCHRIQETCQDYPPDYLQSKLITVEPERMEHNSAIDRYYQVYKLKSSIYRLCAFLGWLELYRQEVVFMDSGRSTVNRHLNSCLAAIRSDLADGQLNTAEDWMLWTDHLIFREEQRAIGESMLVQTAGEKSVMGYGKFCEFLQEKSSQEQNRWFRQAVYFMTDLQDNGRDFRLVRLRRLVIHLIDLIELLEPAYISSGQHVQRQEYKQLCGIA